ncbi:MAG: Sec-independent protein translocase subunit TatB [Proteobacteria bacterium]|nr:Sec-independent protein translocase subunit TatB [Pseudomonadota bacterium]
MFDIGFSELVVIGLVALIVIGPERLPRVARTVGHLIGRLQRYVADVKSDINREVELEELRKMRDSVQEAAASIETSVTSGLSRTEAEINSTIAHVVPPEAGPVPGSAAPEAAQEAATPADKKP